MADLNPLDVFGEVEKASASEGGQYILPGMHLLEINKLLLKVSQKDGDTLFIAEFKVIESDCEEMTPGSSRSWIVNMSNKQTGPGNVKAFFMGMGPDLQESDITKADMAKAISVEQPAAGIRLKCEAWHVETSKGGLFTRTRWEFDSRPEEEEE